MFFHDEHHLFPQVPTYRLATQAERIDAAAPGRAHQAGFLSDDKEMSKQTDSNLAGLDLDTARRIDMICRRFRS